MRCWVSPNTWIAPVLMPSMTSLKFTIPCSNFGKPTLGTLLWSLGHGQVMAGQEYVEGI